MVSKTSAVFLLVSLFTPFAFAGENYSSLQSGYHDGFYIKTDDDKFRLKVGSRIDFGYTYGFVSPADDFSSFDITHAKFYAGGNAFSPQIQYFFQAAAATNTRPVGFGVPSESQNGTFRLEDYYVRLNWQEMNVKFGQFKVPFGRQWITYSGNFEFVDRSVATQAFTFGRDRGVTFGAERKTFAYTLGIFNGGGDPSAGSGFTPATFLSTGQNVSNDTAGGGTGHLYVARLVAMPAGPAGYSEGDVEMSEGHRMEIGAGFVFDHKRDVDLNGDTVVDDTDANLMNVNGDFAWKHMGKSFEGEFFFRKLAGSLTPDTKAIGFYVQPGYFILPGKLQAAARFGWVDPNLSVSGDRLLEGSAAANLYFFGDHRYKAQLQYTWKAQESPVAGKNNNSFIDLLFQLTI